MTQFPLFESILKELDETKKNQFLTDNEINDCCLEIKTFDKNSFENIPSHLKGIGKAVRSASPGKWRTNFSDEEKTVMNSIMGKTLKTLGYNKN